MTVFKIERISPRPGVVERPLHTAKGFKLGDPALGDEKHHGSNALYVSTLEEAAQYVRRGFSLWMHGPGKRPSLICPKSLRIVER